MTFTKKVAIYLSVVTARVFSVHSDAKPSRNSITVPTVTTNLKKFTLAELRKATRNFGSSIGFGPVFEGWVHKKTYAPSKFGVGMAIAVERLSTKRWQEFEEWLSEEPLLGGYNHPNLVKLLGYCKEDKKRLLVFEYMQEGSLDTHLFKRKKLSWLVRLKIAIGAARGLAYLHTTENQVIYRNFRTSKILLDWEFNAKLFRCELARFLGPVDDTEVATFTTDTKRYMAPEYELHGQVTTKVDAYAFGVVLLELLTGQRLLDAEWYEDNVLLVNWARRLGFTGGGVLDKELLDPQIKDSCSAVAVILMSSLILECLDDTPENRPSMVEVVKTLERIASMTVQSSDIMF